MQEVQRNIMKPTNLKLGANKKETKKAWSNGVKIKVSKERNERARKKMERKWVNRKEEGT
jgi:hypothetical protein